MKGRERKEKYNEICRARAIQNSRERERERERESEREREREGERVTK